MAREVTRVNAAKIHGKASVVGGTVKVDCCAMVTRQRWRMLSRLLVGASVIERAPREEQAEQSGRSSEAAAAHIQSLCLGHRLT